MTITAIGHPLLDAPADWELFGRGQDVVVRIQLALGRITRTAVPGLASGGGVSFVVGPDRVIIRPLDFVPGYLVPDGHPARDLPATLAQGGPALPGPDREHLWVQSLPGGRQSMMLVDFAGRPTGVAISFPSDLGPASSDSAGYLLYYGTGGIYQARTDGLRRVTTGILLAAGPTRWVTVDCDYRYRCSTYVTDRASGRQRRLNTQVDIYAPGGVVSPDGNTAAVLRNDGSAGPALYLLDLTSCAAQRTAVSVGPAQDNGGYGSSFIWSPDSRWLFVEGAEGRVLVLDRHTGHAVDLGVDLPPLNQLAFRSSSR